MTGKTPVGNYWVRGRPVRIFGKQHRGRPRTQSELLKNKHFICKPETIL